MLLESARHGFETELLARMGTVTAAPSIEAKSGTGNWRVDRVFEQVGNVGVVHIVGAIDKHISAMDMDCYGGCDLADIDAALSIIENNPAIERVVLNVNSPGGSVIGVAETAARVKRLTETKEVHAYIDALCASAGYYIASQADHITAAPSAMVGSIGVYLALLDETRALEMEGYKVELIKAGKFKAMGASFKALSDEERQLLQSEVDGLYSEFTGAVRSVRSGVSDDTMQGQTFRGTEAKKRGLVDDTTNANLDEFVASML